MPWLTASSPSHRVPCWSVAALLCAVAVLGCQRPQNAGATAPATPYPPAHAAAYPPAYPPAYGAASPPSSQPQPADLGLPPPWSDAGVLVRMLLAETKGPAYPDYDEREAGFAMQAMKAVVHNRLFSAPQRFGARDAHYYADIICAPGQWAGFGRGAAGEYLVEPEILERVDEILARANQGAQGPYYRFVELALAVTYGGVSDPYARLHFVQGTAVLPGAYGWRRQDAGSPGGDLLPIPEEQGGVLAGNRFYALRANGSLKTPASDRAGDRRARW